MKASVTQKNSNSSNILRLIYIVFPILCVCLYQAQSRFTSYLELWMPNSTMYLTHAILLNKQELHRYLWVQSMVPWKVHIPWDCLSLLECNFLCFKSWNNNRKNITNSLRKSGQYRKLLLKHFDKIHFLCLYHTDACPHMHIWKKEIRGHKTKFII